MRKVVEMLGDVLTPERATKPQRANDREIDGDHYQRYGDIQPWDLWHIWKLNPFQAAMLKHVARYPHKGEAVLDLEKIIHYAEKALEIERSKQSQQ